MDAGLVFVIAVAVVGAVLVVALLARNPKHPEDAASHHDERPATTSDRFYGGSDAPAGADLEDGPRP